MAEGSRPFPPPWRADKLSGGYVVRDANGQAIAYLYSRENEVEARQAKVLTALLRRSGKLDRHAMAVMERQRAPQQKRTMEPARSAPARCWRRRRPPQS
jgi:hypothetical protein